MHLEKIIDYPAARDGYSLAASSVANDASLLFLFATKDLQRAYLVRATTTGDEVAELPPIDVCQPKIDVFPDGRILLVTPRCLDLESNGLICSPWSQVSRRIHLGDGISHAHVDALGRIWVSFFDEGVYGDSATGAAGLVCFAGDGSVLWRYPDDAKHKIDDCYALNVCNDEAAVFFYSDFPLCTISAHFELTCRATPLQGCAAFARSERQVLFTRQYRDPPGTAYLADVMPERVENVRSLRLMLRDGDEVPDGCWIGRGPHLYFFDGSSVYRVSIG